MINDRIRHLVKLANFIQEDSAVLQLAMERAEQRNPWFTRENIQFALHQIRDQFLQEDKLQAFATSVPPFPEEKKKVGMVMAGNIPLVGFHDFLCGFLSGHSMKIKLSSKDDVLLPMLTHQLIQMDKQYAGQIEYCELLKDCDAYIATGSGNSSRYFEYYFSRFPHIIRKNRTSVAILTGTERVAELEALADDVYRYFGLGCRNVTHLYVPEQYNFVPLLEAFRKYDYLKEHHKYRNNYDYNLALFILNKQFYMCNDSLLLSENESVFSPISVLHYSFYRDVEPVVNALKSMDTVQAVVGYGGLPFGVSQCPAMDVFADGVNTLQFLQSL